MMSLTEKNKYRREINMLYSRMDSILNGAAGRGSLIEKRAREKAAALKKEIDNLSTIVNEGGEGR